MIAISTSFLLSCVLSEKIDPYNLVHSVKLGYKERIDSEHLGNSEPLPTTNLPVNNLALVNNVAKTKKILFTKFDCTTIL